MKNIERRRVETPDVEEEQQNCNANSAQKERKEGWLRSSQPSWLLFSFFRLQNLFCAWSTCREAVSWSFVVFIGRVFLLNGLQQIGGVYVHSTALYDCEKRDRRLTLSLYVSISLSCSVRRREERSLGLSWKRKNGGREGRRRRKQNLLFLKHSFTTR